MDVDAFVFLMSNNVEIAINILSKSDLTADDIVLAVDIASRNLSPKFLSLCILTLKKRKEIQQAFDDPFGRALEEAHKRSSLEHGVDLDEYHEDEFEEEEQDEPEEEEEDLEVEEEEEEYETLVKAKVPKKKKKIFMEDIPEEVQVEAKKESEESFKSPKKDLDVEKEDTLKNVKDEPIPAPKRQQERRLLPPNTSIPGAKKAKFVPKNKKGEEIDEITMTSFLKEAKERNENISYLYQSGSDELHVKDKVYILSRNEKTKISDEIVNATIRYDTEKSSWMVRNYHFVDSH